ncbi:MAG: hypothetical protein LLG04_08470 [Parachlamydia sp.]|nr:hypothetical protein [Parachlamydia sp.]
MNVLLFATSMILLLATLTYARIETYRSFSILQGEFNRYMEMTERSAINNAARTWYETSVASRSTGKGSQQKGKKQALSRLSFVVFIDSKKQGAYSQEYPQLVILAKKLMAVLYKDQRFYKEMEQKRPDFTSQLLASLMIAENQPQEQKMQQKTDQKMTRASDLANLNLQDQELNSAFYSMLQGTITPREKGDLLMSNLPCQIPDQAGEEEDEYMEPGKEEEVKSPQGYYSLLDFITLQDAAKVRVYLAARPLLLAIFDDPVVVQSLVETRCHLYTMVIKGTMTADQASEALRTQFLSQSKGFDETILDFSVTKTNPRNYE